MNRALASVSASSTIPSSISVLPSKLRTPKMSMISNGRKRLKKTAARLRRNILALAMKSAQSMTRRMPNGRIGLFLVLAQVVTGEIDENVLEVGQPLDALLSEATTDELVDERLRRVER